MADLNVRKQQILRAIIVEYVIGAEPVSSELVASKYDLGVRSATIRNEMAEITDLGLLEQPHTSAGRIPSDFGYRYFVDNIAEPIRLRAAERQQISDSMDEEEPLRELLQATTTALSRVTHLLSMATTLQNGSIVVRNAVLTSLGNNRALLVLILDTGATDNRFLELPINTTNEDVYQANALLAASLVGRPLKDLLRWKPATGIKPQVEAILKRVANTIRTAARELTKLQVVTEGEEFILAQPEFQRDVEAMQRVLAALEEGEELKQLVAQANVREITIGRENDKENLRALAIVRQSLYIGQDRIGTLAIVGPTRMDYMRVRALLDMAARGIAQTLGRGVGPSSASNG
ncbi:MAG: heat-inducible transcription repressor HrcA [Fimbriimonadaceae bacterium]|nr:heat-inducible transcription repressor HrcA [Fimbriimonadaceae bacterium]